MPEQVLFIGHSLVGYKMPQMFNSFMDTLGIDAEVDRQVINGAPLRYNWDNGGQAEGVNARAVLPSGAYDSVIVTEALPLDEHIRWNNSQGYADRYYDLARSANPDTQFYILETWHSINGNAAAWRAKLDTDLPKWEGIADYINSNAPNGANPALLIPAGQAMAQLYDAIQAGQIPGITSITAVFEDSIHLNDLGNWFMAALQAATILGLDPASLPSETVGRWNVTYDGPNAALKSALAGVISDTLAEYDRDGRDDGTLQPVGGGDQDNEPDPQPEDTPDGGDVTPPPANDNGDDAPTAPVNAGSGDIAFGLGFGLTTVADYVSNMPFVDVFKTSRPALGHEPGRWGGIDYAELQARGVLDADGWLTSMPDGVNFVGSLILTSLPAEMTEAAGRYRVTWEGEGEVRIGLSASNVTIGQNEAWFTYTPTGSAMVNIEVHETDPRGNGNYVRNISVVKENHISAFEAGEIFNPTWIDVIEDAHSLRFMDWMRTTDSKIETVSDMPQQSDATWTPDGVPLSVMVQLANKTGTDPWFTIPHLADEAYMRAFVSEVRDTLAPGLKAYFEFSNEVWNFQFSQAQHSHAVGQARFPGEGTAWVQNYAADSVEMARIIDDIYGDNSPDVVKVISTQTGWIGLEGAILNAPSWVAENPSVNAAPSTYFDAYAITGYFDGGLGRGDKPVIVKRWIEESESRAASSANAQGLSGAEREAYFSEHRFDYATTLAAQELRDGSVTGNTGGSLAQLRTQFAYHKDIADSRGLELVMYEGGTHVVGVGSWGNDSQLTEFFTHLNYTAEMAELYEELLQIWEEEGGTLFHAFTAVGAPSKHGSWGHLRFLGDDNPRMDVIEDFIADNPRPDGGNPVVPAPTPDANSDPEGVVAIVGTPEEGERLSATLNALRDDDGIIQSSVSYQWQRDGVNVNGATSATYLLTEADVGANIRVTVQYRDLGGTTETVSSGHTVDVADRAQPPQGNLRIEGEAQEGVQLSVNWAAISDIDVSTLDIQWMRGGVEIPGATNTNYTLTQADVGAVISVVAVFRDGDGNSGRLSANQGSSVTNVNNTPEGRPIIEGALQVGATLFANVNNVSDVDGLPARIGWIQWERDGVEIPGAIGPRYVLREADNGTQITVSYYFRDQFGSNEHVYADAAARIGDETTPLRAIVSVEGEAEVGAVLAAQASFTGDAGMLDSASGSWNWIRTDATGQQTEVIQGAQSEYYTLRAEDQGHLIMAQYSFRDTSGDAGSARGGSLLVNTSPTGGVTILAGSGQTASLRADTSALEDADGIIESSLTYQWFLDNAPISGATQVRLDANAAELAGSVSVRVSYMDEAGFTQSLISDPVPMSSDGMRLNGTNADDLLIGGGGSDTLLGADGDDYFIPGGGSDFLDGGRGIDTLALMGDQSAYTLRLADNGSRLTDRTAEDEGGQGSKTLFGIETLDFETEIDVLQGRPLQLALLDDAVNVSSADLEEITELYVAYFNRAPDAIGLTYWASLFANGLDLQQMARGFFDQPETRATYADVLSSDGAGLTDVDGFVSAVYANVLGRVPDADGFAFWVNALENVPEITPATFILSVLGGAKNPANPTPQTQLDQSYIATKTDIGTYFAAIKGLSNVQDAKAVMSLYDGTIGSMIDAVREVDDVYADALDPVNGEFLMQLVGIVEDPFAALF